MERSSDWRAVAFLESGGARRTREPSAPGRVRV